jgi:cyclopropane-fatty-acyl-phospholipid synthase
MAWYNNFERYARDRAQPLDQQFHRMWRYYLLTFAGCFRSRKRLQLWQLVYSPQGVAAGYRSVR